jgi:predicted DNA-binding transcriptional regulator AlpA
MFLHEVNVNQPEHDVEQPTTEARSIPEFCAAWRISVPHFYRLEKKGLMPDVFEIGDRALITREAEHEWKQRTRAASNRLRAQRRGKKEVTSNGTGA